MTDTRLLRECDHYDCTAKPVAVYSGFAVETTDLYCYHPCYCETHAKTLGDADPQKVQIHTLDSRTA